MQLRAIARGRSEVICSFVAHASILHGLKANTGTFTLAVSTRVEILNTDRDSQPTSRGGLVSTRVESSTRVHAVLKCYSVNRSVNITRVGPVSNPEIFRSVKRP